MKKLKYLFPDIFLLVYICVVAFGMMMYISTKDRIIANSGDINYRPTYKQVLYMLFNGEPEVPELEMPYMPGSADFDWNDPSISYNQVKEAIISSHRFEWTISEEHEYIKLEKGWSLNPINHFIVDVVSRDPFADGKMGIGTDGIKARYNQTCSMKGIPYGTRLWLKGSGTTIVVVVTDNEADYFNQVILHQCANRNTFGKLDGHYEVVQVSPPVTSTDPDKMTLSDFEEMYKQWKTDTQNELSRYNEWLDFKEENNIVEA